MKYLKMLWLAAIAMAAAMAFASTAFAALATSPAGTPYTGTLKGASEGEVTFHGVITLSCEAEVEGIIESHGTSVTGKGKSTKWEYINCTGGNTIHSIATGTIEVHTVGKGEGTITATGTTGLATIPSLGLKCEFTTSSTDIGLITDSSITGGKATIDFNGVELPRTGGSIFCGPSAEMTGSAVVNSPEKIFID